MRNGFSKNSCSIFYNKWILVLMMLHMFTLIVYFTIWRLYQFLLASDFWQRFRYIVLRRYLLLNLFNKYRLPWTLGRVVLFNFNYKPLFLLTNNTFYHITFFYIALISIISNYIAYDPKASSIFDHISYSHNWVS